MHVKITAYAFRTAEKMRYADERRKNFLKKRIYCNYGRIRFRIPVGID